MTPTDLDKTTSIYDYDTHTPYPTIQFILDQTGEDMIVLAGSKIKARAEIRQLTDEVKSVLFRNKLRKTYNDLEYLIATKANFRYDFIKTVAQILYQEYNNVNDDKETIILNGIKGSTLLSIEHFTRIEYKYREGY